MEYTVFLTQQPNSRWRAVIPDLPDCTVEATTRTEALETIRRRAIAVFNQTEVLRLGLPLPSEAISEAVSEQPLETSLRALGYGAFKDDPTLDSLFEEIERQRDARLIED